MTASEVHGVGTFVDPVRVGMQLPIVGETHQRTRRYPESLVPPRRIRVNGFTVSLDIELSGKPETAALGRRLFEKVCDAIEDVIAGRYQNVSPGTGVDDQGAHEGEPTDSERRAS